MQLLYDPVCFVTCLLLVTLLVEAVVDLFIKHAHICTV